MGEILLWLLAFVGAIAVILGVLIWLGRRKVMKQQAAATKPEPVKDPLQPEYHASNDPAKIQVGSVVEILGAAYYCRGIFTFTDDAYSWKEFFLEMTDASGRYWLAYELDDGIPELVLYQDIKDTTDAPQPGPKQVVLEGVTYTRNEKGSARYTTEGGTAGLASQGRVEYFDYKADGGKMLSFERFNGRDTWEVSLGTQVPTQVLQVFPASRI